jgi:hypothetical protein
VALHTLVGARGRGETPRRSHTLCIIGGAIEIFGVLVIVTGIAWSTYRQLQQPISEQAAEVYKIRIGRSLLLGLEVLVATQLVRCIKRTRCANSRY